MQYYAQAKDLNFSISIPQDFKIYVHRFLFKEIFLTVLTDTMHYLIVKLPSPKASMMMSSILMIPTAYE